MSVSNLTNTQDFLPKALWQTALYIRLSREDSDKEESNSVGSQREILKEYLKQHPDMELVDIYIDDGYSGTNFDRPAFKRMMEDIYAKKVNCVVVKDLSRFGRNYVVMGDYLDNIFVKQRVRFVALNNQHDTVANSVNPFTQLMSVGLTNIVNESQAATTSVNVRGTLNLRRKQGKFIGSFATFGYMKDPNDKHKLIIDKEAARIVQMIFSRFVAGESILGITKYLNDSGILNPSAYKKSKGLNYKHSSGKSDDGLWPDSSVRRILQNRMYIGDMVQGKNTTYSYKIKQCYAVPKDEWIIVKGTHEPIIEQEVFDLAQSLFNKHIRKSPKCNNLDLFSGLVRCADCRRAMNKKTNKHPYGTYEYYRCVTALKMKKSACTSHTIRIDKLEQAVFVTIQKMIDTAIDMNDALGKINNHAARKTECEEIEKAIKNHTEDKEKISIAIADLYPDWKSGVITKEEYTSIKSRLNDKLLKTDEKIAALKREKEQFSKGVSEENEFITHFKKYGNIKKLTRPLLTELVEEILVYEGGKIEVVFKFKEPYLSAADYISLNESLIAPKKNDNDFKTA